MEAKILLKEAMDIKERYGRSGTHQQQLQHSTVYHRDRLGRISQKDSHWKDSVESESSRYFYDKQNRLTRAFNKHSEIRLSYNSHGQLEKEQFRILGEPISLNHIRPRRGDGIAQITEHRYDILGNRIQTILPTGETLNYLYYGSGHLHHINLDGTTISDIERDDLHRPIQRSAGSVAVHFQLDPLGRLKSQLAQLQSEQHNQHNELKGIVARNYHYDQSGNLIQTQDKRTGLTEYRYDPLGRIIQAGEETFTFDPAHNISNKGIKVSGNRLQHDPLGRIIQAGEETFAFDPAHNISNKGIKVSGNRLQHHNGIEYRYDELGNLSERHNQDKGEYQYYSYNAENQLTEARIERKGMPSEVWQYRYDALGRRISKRNQLSGKTQSFIWDGSRLLQERTAEGTYTYVYTEQESHEPLAQIYQVKSKGAEAKPAKQILYYHTDQIGIPKELTDENGDLVWTGSYTGWGKLAEEGRLKEQVHQPLRLQNQYCDKETGLHYNFFRYYDAHCGRFTQQDPIGLAGGESLYAYTPNISRWVDIMGAMAQVAAGCAIGSPFGGPIGCGAGALITGVITVIGAGAILSTSNSSTQTKDQTASATCGSCNKPQPKCPPDVYQGLHAAVEKAKKYNSSLDACKPWMNFSSLYRRKDAAFSELRARKAREDTCWNGGDSGHRERMRNLQNQANNCDKLIGRRY